jgi:hypothetical protein
MSTKTLTSIWQLALSFHRGRRRRWRNYTTEGTLKGSTVAAALAALVLAARDGTGFKWDEARQIKAGMTEAEVVALMGPPT